MGILKKHNAEAANAAAEASTPAFEGEQDAGQAVEQETTIKTVTREQVAPAETKPAEKAAAESTQAAADSKTAVEQPTEEAPAKTTAVIARTEGGALKTIFSGGKVAHNPLADLKDAFVKNGVEIDYNTFPRLRVDSGHIATAEGKDAGEHIEIQVMSYGPSWVIGSGTDDEESKKHVRFSNDGKTVKGAGDDDVWAGKSIDEYKEHLRELGYEKAALKEYTVVHGIALDAQEVSFAHLNEMVSLQLAPESKRKYDGYIMNRGIAARMGRIVETSGHPVVRFTTERAKNAQGKSYFNVIPSHGKTAPVDFG
jgi:hypothetical protein